MSIRLEVGGKTKAYCTTCKAMQDHVIVALVGVRPAKVECDVCHKQHLYRANLPGAKVDGVPKSTTKRPSTRAKAKPAAPVETVDIRALLAGRASKPYDPNARFAVGDVVKHTSFGVGLVSMVPGPQKVEITFPDGPRLLSHDRAAVTRAPLAPPPRRAEEERMPTEVPSSRRRV